MQKINYIKIKRKDKIGECNICRKTTKLTWDHVPPKASILYDDVEIKSIFSRHSKGKYPRELSQNGTKYRTICSSCNNLLGTWYDIEFNRFIEELISEVYFKAGKQPLVTVSLKPVKLLKSLFGHLLAAKHSVEESTFDEEMRRFVMDKYEFNTKLNVFCWYFPYGHIEVARDLAIVDFTKQTDTHMLSILKLYPIGFYVTFDQNVPEFENCINISNLCTVNPDQSSFMELDIDFNNLIRSDWPIYVDNSRGIMGGESSRSAIISQSRKRVY